MRATLGSTFEVVEGLIDGKQRRNLTILLYGPWVACTIVV